MQADTVPSIAPCKLTLSKALLMQADTVQSIAPALSLFLSLSPPPSQAEIAAAAAAAEGGA